MWNQQFKSQDSAQEKENEKEKLEVDWKNATIYEITYSVDLTNSPFLVKWMKLVHCVLLLKGITLFIILRLNEMKRFFLNIKRA